MKKDKDTKQLEIGIRKNETFLVTLSQQMHSWNDASKNIQYGIKVQWATCESNQPMNAHRDQTYFLLFFLNTMNDGKVKVH